MSCVSTVMIQFHGIDEDPSEDLGFQHDAANLSRIQETLARLCEGQQLRCITDGDGNSAWGGHKIPSATLYAAGINYLPLDNFIAELRQLSWHDPELFRLFVQTEDDGAFGVWIIRDGVLECAVEPTAW